MNDKTTRMLIILTIAAAGFLFGCFYTTLTSTPSSASKSTINYNDFSAGKFLEQYPMPTMPDENSTINYKDFDKVTNRCHYGLCLKHGKPFYSKQDKGDN